MDVGGTCYSRYLALKSLVPEVIVLEKNDAMKPYKGFSVGRVLEKFGARSLRLIHGNTSFLKLAKEIKPTVVWIDKADWVLPATLKALRAQNISVVQHTTDSLFPRKVDMFLQRSLLRMSIDYCSAFLTTNALDISRLRKRMSQRLLHTRMAYDEKRFNQQSSARGEIKPGLRSEICFIGHFEPRTAKYVECLHNAGIPVVVYGGRDWANTSVGRRLGIRLRPAVWGQDYVDAIRGTKIALCFLSEWNYNESTVRTFEIPACKTFMLGMRTDEHEKHFRSGSEAVFFNGEVDLVLLAKKYLADDTARERIAMKGFERCLSGRHNWRNVMEDDWAELERRKLI
jgi:hypothetical protein